MPEFRSKIVVTGAASGIGRAVADHLGEAGAEVIRLDLTEAGGCLPFDVASERDWDALDPTGVTGLVHAAGIRSRSPIRDTHLQDFRRIHEVNVIGTFLALRWAARRAALSDAGRFSVVTLASAVIDRTVEDQAAYNASKAAVAALTRSAARELAEEGVRVNAIAPGSILTPLTDQGWSDDVHAARMRTEIPARRPGQPHEIAAIAAFLLSDASSYVTGAVWTADGGWTA